MYSTIQPSHIRQDNDKIITILRSDNKLKNFNFQNMNMLKRYLGAIFWKKPERLSLLLGKIDISVNHWG